jgi:hypothetical protein
MRELNGDTHSLAGAITALKHGDHAAIEGAFAGASACAAGAAINVTRIR